MTAPGRSRWESWEYREMLQTALPSIVAEPSEQTLDLVARLLAKEVGTRRSRGDLPIWPDGSEVWHQAIETDSAERHGEPRNALISYLRQASIHYVKTKPDRIPAVMAALEAQRWAVFHRIGLCLLSAGLPQTLPLARAKLLDETYFHHTSVRHEYNVLLGQCYPKLSQTDQDQLWTMIGRDASDPEFHTFVAQRLHRSLSAAEVDEIMATHMRDRVAPFAGHLDEDRRALYETWTRQFGPPVFHEFPVRISGGIGPKSRVTVVDLQPLADDELVDFLKRWRPDDGDWDDSPQGLARVLASLVASAPVRFAALAPRFLGLRSTYIRALLDGLAKGMKQDGSFAWPPVLDLCEYVANMDEGEVDRLSEDALDPFFDFDRGLAPARRSACGLLREGLQAGAGEIPFELRARVWAAFASLARDPDPTVERERDADGMDYFTLAINTTRGAAVEAVVHYAQWVRRGLSSADSPAPHGPEQSPLHGMPEVQALLEEHLDPARDPSLAVRAVYGGLFPWIAGLDDAWARTIIPRVFPGDQASTLFRDVAWTTLIRYTRPYGAVYKLLEREYGEAVATGSAPALREEDVAEYINNLAAHVAALYLADLTGPATDTNVAFRLAGAPGAAARAALVESTGRQLWGWKGDLPHPVAERARALWEHIVARAATSPPPREEELKAFGWWFAATGFDPVWALGQLRRVLETVGDVAADHQVVKRLAELAPTHAQAVFEITETWLLRDADRAWRIHVWEDEVRVILGSAVAAPQPAVSKAAKASINRLAARGIMVFTALLHESES